MLLLSLVPLVLYAYCIFAYLGVIILAGVYKSKAESTASVWDAGTARFIFRATMSLCTFHVFSKVIPFNNQETRAVRRKTSG